MIYSRSASLFADMVPTSRNMYPSTRGRGSQWRVLVAMIGIVAGKIQLRLRRRTPPLALISRAAALHLSPLYD